MNITFSESPSFVSGWCVRADTKRKIIQMRDLSRDSHLRVASHLEPFPSGSPFCDLEPEEDVLLSQLLDQVRLKVDQKVGFTLDGTLHALSIVSGDTFIGLEWNSQIPRGCSGIEELVLKLRNLADVCRERSASRKP